MLPRNDSWKSTASTNLGCKQELEHLQISEGV